MKLFHFLAVTFKLAIALSLSKQVNAKVLVLTESNFEHETQASTGATTGNHFVKFYAPWCGHCKKLEPTWESLSEELLMDNEYGAVIGKVDATQNKKIAKLYGVSSYPTLLMFNQGKMIKYQGSRDLESLLKFCRGGFLGKHGYPVEDVPVPKNAVEEIVEMILEDLDNLWKFKKAALAVTFFAGLFVGTLLCCMCAGSRSESSKSNNKKTQ